MTSNTFLINKTRLYIFTHSWLFCYKSMTVSAISFIPQKVCTMIVTLYFQVIPLSGLPCGLDKKSLLQFLEN